MYSGRSIFIPERRSFCTRSSMTTSVPRRASSMCRVTRTPGARVVAMSGTSSGGPQRIIFTPNLLNRWHVDVLRHQIRRPGVGMADDDNVGANGAHRVSRIQQRFALLDTRTGGLDEDGVSAQRFGGDFKRTPGAGGSLVEKKEHPLALEQGPRLVRIHAPGKLQKPQDLGCFQVLDTEQGTARWIHSCQSYGRLLLFHEQDFLRVID